MSHLVDGAICGAAYLNPQLKASELSDAKQSRSRAAALDRALVDQTYTAHTQRPLQVVR